MKNVMQKAGLVLGVALLAFTACKKEDLNRVAATVSEDTEIAALADQAASEMISESALGESPEIGVVLLTEGIAADFLVEQSDLTEMEGPAGNDDRLRGHIRSHSFVACLRRLELSDDQILKTKRAIAAFEQCRESAIKRARAIHKNLVEAYQSKFERLRLAYKNGDISEEEFKAAVHRLRHAFNTQLRELQLKEKLDEALKNCYRKFLGHLKEILDDDQWKRFVACHRR